MGVDRAGLKEPSLSRGPAFESLSLRQASPPHALNFETAGWFGSGARTPP